MKKAWSLALLGCVFAIGFASIPPDPPVRQIDPVKRAAQIQRRNSIRAERIAAEGGLVVQACTGKVYRVVIKDNAVERALLEPAVNDFQRILKIPVVIGTDGGASEKSSGATLTLKKAGTGPTLLLAPEDMWVELNVDRLQSDKPAADVFKARLTKEFWRASCMVLGAYVSMSQPCVMQPITSLEGLDAYKPLTPTPDPFSKMLAVARKMGIHPVRRTSYRKACEEGWAPAPTNEIQVAIAKKVKEEKERGPIKPITIAPPEKK